MEIWKDVPGFGNRYQVSNLGRVKVKSYIRSNGYGLYATKEKILHPFKEKCGHRKIVLCFEGKMTRIKLHRLIAMVFIPNPENKPEVDHINTDVEDNRVENLRWVTSSENKLNPITRARNSRSRLGKNTKPVKCLTKRGELICCYKSIKDAGNDLNISKPHIGQCCNGIRKTAGGYKWEYAL